MERGASCSNKENTWHGTRTGSWHILRSSTQFSSHKLNLMYTHTQTYSQHTHAPIVSTFCLFLFIYFRRRNRRLQRPIRARSYCFRPRQQLLPQRLKWIRAELEPESSDDSNGDGGGGGGVYCGDDNILN